MKQLTASLLLSLFFFTARANTFTVTSNADSGPGTLREAITLANANGTATRDTVVFALADLSITGRTVLLQTPLPDLKSNLVIDGSTQQGLKIGVSDARVRIAGAPGFRLEYVFRIVDQKNFWFFGLHIDNVISPVGNFLGGIVIAVMNAENIFIGAPGKGNYFTNIQAVAREAALPRAGRGITAGLSFKSNILNLSEDGNSIVSNGLLFALDNLKNLELGGETDSEGNFMAGQTSEVLWTYTDTFANINTGYYKIINNKFGCNYDQTAALKCGSVYFRNRNSFGYTDTTFITIKNNTYNSGLVAGSNWLQSFVRIENKKGFIDIKGNKVGLLSSNFQSFFSNISTAFGIGGCENGIIGGNSLLDTNVVAGCLGTAVSLGNNKAIEITKNSFYCNSAGIKISSSQLIVPKTKIFTITDYAVAGTTLPGSRVEVFLTKTCTGCDNGKTYLGNTTADTAGNWNFTAAVLLDGAVTATGTSTQNSTGEFAKPEYGFDNFSYKSPTCNLNNGYIKGIKFIAGTRYYWLRSYSGGVDSLFTEDVQNAGPGVYRFVVEQGRYCSATYSVSLNDLSPKINSQSKSLVHPSCGLRNGKILSHFISGSYNKVYWKDADGNVVGTAADLVNVGTGQYKLVALDTAYGCGDSTQFYTLINQSGPSLNTAALQITPATCGNSTGSITGITATNVSGSPFIRWVDSLNKPVGNGYDLTNVPPGNYRLRFKDAGGCDTIITQFYTVGNNGNITIDVSNKLILPARCSGNTGSIQNIAVEGGSNYQWINTTTGSAVGSTLPLSNLPAGTYRLTVSNSLGCTKTSPLIAVPQTTFIPLNVQAWGSVAANCGKPNGGIDAQTFSRDTSQYRFRWVDSLSPQTVLSTHTKLRGVYGGTYILFAKDSNGCEQQILTKAIINLPVPSFDYSNVQITADNCLSGRGGIANLAVSDMRGGTGTYVWLNATGDSVANALAVQNLSPGTYRLKATDLIGCAVVSQALVVTNVNTPLAPPLCDDQTVLINTAAALKVRNVQSGKYQWLDDPSGATLLQESTTGTFVTPVLPADKVYYLRHVKGVCSSNLVPVKITVVDKTAVYVPTGFTPNGDGKNDVLKIVAYGKVRLQYFTVFNRWGEVVFSSDNFNKTWNGTVNGAPAPGGVYVWIVKAVDELSGQPILQKGSVIVLH